MTLAKEYQRYMQIVQHETMPIVNDAFASSDFVSMGGLFDVVVQPGLSSSRN